MTQPTRGRRAVALADRLDHPLTQAFALGVNGVLYQTCRHLVGLDFDQLDNLRGAVLLVVQFWIVRRLPGGTVRPRAKLATGEGLFRGKPNP